MGQNHNGIPYGIVGSKEVNTRACDRREQAELDEDECTSDRVRIHSALAM